MARSGYEQSDGVVVVVVSEHLVGFTTLNKAIHRMGKRMKLQKKCMKLKTLKSASSYYCSKVTGIRDAAARGARNSRLRLFRPTSRQHHR